MSVNDELGKRMKDYYETVSKTKLIRRTPVAIRLDGRSFHTFTRGFARPFDEILIKSMQNTMKYLCENIQGCVLGYHQSDEITLILIDYKKLTSSAWFDYEVQKMCSIAASMATMAFNKFFNEEVKAHAGLDLYDKLLETYCNACDKGAMFDARVFNIPKEEVTNLIYWRQLDAARNSVQMVGQSYFSHKQLQNKSCNQIQDMLMTEKGINWNDFPTHQKRGSCCIKSETTTTAFVEGETKTVERPHWYIDLNIPQFKNEGREYIDRLIRVDDDCSRPCNPIVIY